ncbi:MAG: DNA/RNA non-specific endonuclease [Burkholderiales bacterium]|nr:DNA/RNA non-specific endonuclease [Burkholderiales bacterium]
MKKLYILMSILSVTSYESYAASCNIASISCLNGCCPEGTPRDNYLVNHKIFTLSSNKVTKLADWVSYIVEAKNIAGSSKDRIWNQDPNISAEDTMLPDDYDGANAACGYSRGHQAPLGAFKGDNLWNNVNYLSNITPQMAELNNGVWERLETAERNLTSKYAKVYVVTGPYYTNELMCTLPNSSVNTIVPNGYWKTISVLDQAGNSQSVSFMMGQNTRGTAKYCDHKTTIQNIQDKTKLNLLPNRSNFDNKELLIDLGCN